MKFAILPASQVHKATHTAADGARHHVRAVGDSCNLPEVISAADLAALESAHGLTPIPAEAPVVHVPQRVTPLQLRAAINAAGLRTAVDAALAAAPIGARDAWEVATEARRDDPTLNQLATALGLTSEQVDAVFLAAANL